MAKLHNTLVIDGSRHRASPLLIQHGHNTGGSVIFALKHAVRNLTIVNTQVRFKKEMQMATFNIKDEAVTVTYNFGTDGNYISNTDRARACLTILRQSKRRDGVASKQHER